MSSHSLTAEELNLLNTIKNQAGENGYAKVFDVNEDGKLVAVVEMGSEISIEELAKRLDLLVERGLLKSAFDSKVLVCGRCGSKRLRPKTLCTACVSEDIVKSPVYLHGCGALIPEIAASRLTSCPKCGESLSQLKVFEYRFYCRACGAIFEEPRAFLECLGCGWSDHVKNADQVILEKYMLTEEGLGMLVSADPLRRLVRKLVFEGYSVRPGVRVRGISGAEYVLDAVAVKRDGSETIIYMVFYKVSPVELVNSAVKRLDVEKTAIEGVVGRVRWVAAGLEVDPTAEQVAKTFGVDLELIS